MNPETIAALKELILPLLAAGGTITLVVRWLLAEQTARRLRNYADADKVEKIMSERAEEQHQRNIELEAFVQRVLQEKDAQLQELKGEVRRKDADVMRALAEVAECRQKDAETRVLNAELSVRQETNDRIIRENRELILQQADRIMDLETVLRARGWLTEHPHGSHPERHSPDGQVSATDTHERHTEYWSGPRMEEQG